MQYKDNSVNNFVEVFAKMTVIISSVAIAHFLKVTCHDIFEHLLAIDFKNEGFFGSVSIYFGRIERNSQEMLYLYCLV